MICSCRARPTTASHRSSPTTASRHRAANAHVALDQKAYQKKYDDLTTRYESLKTRIEDLNEQINQTQSQKGSVEDFLAAFEKLPETLTAFSLDAFNALTDYLTVNAGAIFANNLNVGTRLSGGSSSGILDQEQRRFQLDLVWKF